MKIRGHFGAILRRSKLFLGHLEVRSITSIKLMALKKNELQLERGALNQRENDTAMASLTSVSFCVAILQERIQKLCSHTSICPNDLISHHMLVR